MTKDEQIEPAQRLRRRKQPTVSIRPACLQDCAQLSRIQVDSYRSAYFGLFPDDYLAQLSYAEQEQDWRLWLPDHPQETFLVAELPDGKIAGYVRGSPGSDQNGFDCELEALHVRQELQGRGIGRALLTAFGQAMQIQGCKAMMLWVLAGNLHARTFYEGVGGRLAGEKRWLMGDFAVHETACGWDLNNFPPSKSDLAIPTALQA